MVDTYTDSLRFTKPEIDANDDLWAPLLNDGLIQLIDDAIASEHVADVTGGNLLLTTNDGATDEARAMFLRVIGTPGVTRNIITNPTSKIYVVKNDSDSQVNVGPTGGVALSIPQGKIVMCYNEELVGCFEVVTDGDFVQVVPAGLITLTVDINGASGGDLTTTAKYTVQGSMVHLNIAGFTSTIGSLFTTLSNAAGDWPAVIVPGVRKEFPCLIYEDTGGGFTRLPCMISINNVASDSILIFPVGPGTFTNPSDRTVAHSMTLVYPTQGI